MEPQELRRFTIHRPQHSVRGSHSPKKAKSNFESKVETIAIASLGAMETIHVTLKVNNQLKHTMKDQDPLDIEENAKSGKPIPKDCELFRIRIDREKYIVQQAALTGRELLKLADKEPDQYRVLFKKCGGQAVKIDLDTNFSFLDPDVEHFVTEERSCGDENAKIFVNSREKTVPGPSISFEEVTKLAFPDLAGKPQVFFTVTYKRGCESKPKGDLLKGQSINVKNGMQFNVRATDKS
jgi:hypothetical protein